MINFAEYSDEQLVKLYQDNRGAKDDFMPEAIMTYLMEKYKPMVRKKTNSLYIIGGDVEDLAQEGMIGIYKAVTTYKDDRGASFSTFAYLCIQSQLNDVEKALGRDKHKPLNEAISLAQVTGEDGILLEDTLVASSADTPEELILEQEFWGEFLQRLDDKLSKMEKRILPLFLAGMKYTDIAEELGKTAKSVDNAIQRIRQKCIELKSEE